MEACARCVGFVMIVEDVTFWLLRAPGDGDEHRPHAVASRS